jgi:hypothetical protein
VFAAGSSFLVTSCNALTSGKPLISVLMSKDLLGHE